MCLVTKHYDSSCSSHPLVSLYQYGGKSKRVALPTTLPNFLSLPNFSDSNFWYWHDNKSMLNWGSRAQFLLCFYLYFRWGTWPFSYRFYLVLSASKHKLNELITTEQQMQCGALGTPDYTYLLSNLAQKKVKIVPPLLNMNTLLLYAPCLTRSLSQASILVTLKI